MDLKLSPIIPIKLFSSHANAWSDQYGSMQIAATHAGLVPPPIYRISGIWHHGCFGPWYEFSAKLLVNFAPNAEKLPVFVAREEQAACLRREGFGAVRAIGLPFVYAPEPDVKRVPGSLLVMPTHSLVGEKHTDRSPFERYADLIARIARNFRHVTICVHPNCARNGLWVKEFSERSLPVIYGAQTNDANALRRMSTLFAAHETVTTNDWGSHVAYALATGARLAIHGEPVVSDWRTFLSDETWAANPGVLEHTYSAEVLGQKREFLSRFYQEPVAAVADVDLGRWLIGAGHRLKPAEMAGVLQTLLSPTPQPLGTSSVGRELPALRRQAAELAAAGQSEEASRLLLQAVRVAVETKNLRFIHATLVQIAADLAPFDPAKAAYLREQAGHLSVRLPATAA